MLQHASEALCVRPALGQPLVAYDASGNRSWMLADERGSIIALANDSAGMTAIDAYDKYRIPAAPTPARSNMPGCCG